MEKEILRNSTPAFSTNKLFAALVFGALGFAGNYFKSDIFFNIDFLFGSIFTMIALSRCGLLYGTAAAAIAASYTYFIWNHPYAIIIFTCEALFVGFFFHGYGRMIKKRFHTHNMAMLDAAYWIFVGMPLVFLFYYGMMHASMDGTQVTAFKQSINGIFNALIASITIKLAILVKLPIRKTSNSVSEKISFQDMLSNLILLFVFIISFAALSHDIEEDVSMNQEQIAKDIKVASELLSFDVERHVDIKSAISVVANATNTQVTIIDSSGKVIETSKKTINIGDTFESVKNAQYRDIGGGITHIIPTGKANSPKSERWRKSIFEKKIYLDGSSQTVIVEKPGESFIVFLNQMTKEYFLSAWCALIIAIIASFYVSRAFMRPIQRLSITSQKLPAKISSGQSVQWREERFSEISLLVDTFKAMEKELAQRIYETKALNEKLESIVEERTIQAHESEAKYRTIFENKNTVMLIINPENGSIVDANEAACSYYGWTKEELISKKIFEINTLSASEIKEQMDLVNCGKKQYCVFKHRRADGSIRDVEVYAGQIKLANKNLLYSIIHDITDRNIAIMEREQFYRFFRTASDIMVIADPNGAFMKTNPACSDILGYSEEELISKPFVQFIHPDDKQATIDEMARQIDKGFSINFENRYICKDGSVKWLSWRAIYNKDEGITYATARDITEQRRLQQAVIDERQRLFSILEGIPAYVYLQAKDYSIAYANSRFKEAFGDIKAKKCHKLMWDSDKPCDYCPTFTVFDTGKPIVWQWDKAPDGRIYQVYDYLFIDHDDSRYALEMGVDITDLKEAQDNLNKINATLEQRVMEEVAKNRDKDQMLAHQARLAAMGEMMGAIAHQWRQPLNALGLILQDIPDAKRFGELTDEYLTVAVEKGMKQINYMSKTIDDFRSFFRPDKEKKFFDIKLAAADVLSMISAQLKTNSISYRLTCHEHNKTFEDFSNVTMCGAFMLHGYENELKQVFLNLTSNSKDAILERRAKGLIGSDEKGQICIDFERQGEKAIIKISDNGGGIPESVMDRIFEPYYTTKEQGKGTGIGLYMSKVIIEQNLGGKLSVRNVDSGVEFKIEL